MSELSLPISSLLKVGRGEGRAYRLREATQCFDFLYNGRYCPCFNFSYRHSKSYGVSEQNQMSYESHGMLVVTVYFGGRHLSVFKRFLVILMTL